MKKKRIQSERAKSDIYTCSKNLFSIFQNYIMIKNILMPGLLSKPRDSDGDSLECHNCDLPPGLRIKEHVL